MIFKLITGIAMAVGIALAVVLIGPFYLFGELTSRRMFRRCPSAPEACAPSQASPAGFPAPLPEPAGRNSIDHEPLARIAS